MNKTTKKRQSYNTDVINALIQEFGVTGRFIRQCINKEKHSITADTIRKKYNELANPSKQAVEKFKQQPLK